jgi:pyruvate dehydrogenase E2 component (dihydrolipoamide acetyltransferase)
MAGTPLTRGRRALVNTMLASAAIPQFALERSVSFEAIGRLRADAAEPEASTFSDVNVLIAAVAHALRAHMYLNASYADDGIVTHDEVNVATAIALEDGLVAPAIQRADTLALAEISGERRRLTSLALAGEVHPRDLLCATFTVSNLGPFGIDRFRALVVPPQAAILAVGALRDDQRVDLTLSVDHRVADGAPAARFLATLAGRLEDPSWLCALL